MIVIDEEVILGSGTVDVYRLSPCIDILLHCSWWRLIFHNNRLIASERNVLVAISREQFHDLCGVVRPEHDCSPSAKHKMHDNFIGADR